MIIRSQKPYDNCGTEDCRRINIIYYIILSARTMCTMVFFFSSILFYFFRFSRFRNVPPPPPVFKCPCMNAAAATPVRKPYTRALSIVLGIGGSGCGATQSASTFSVVVVIRVLPLYT